MPDNVPLRASYAARYGLFFQMQALLIQSLAAFLLQIPHMAESLLSQIPDIVVLNIQLFPHSLPDQMYK